MAMQGLAVVPLFAGYDLDDRRTGRIFSYDVTGGRYEEHSFHAVGSGSMFARGALKKLYRDDLSARRRRRRLRSQALYDAADDDSATGGPDLTRRIFPVVADGHRRRLPPAARRRGRARSCAPSSRGRRADAPDGPSRPPS